jgi:hypothetical protein
MGAAIWRINRIPAIRSAGGNADAAAWRRIHTCNSIATIAIPPDPSDDDGARAAEFVCQLMEKKIGGGN